MHNRSSCSVESPFFHADMIVERSNADEKEIPSHWYFNIEQSTLPFAVCDFTALVGLFAFDLLWEATCRYQKQNPKFFLLCDAGVITILKNEDILMPYIQHVQYEQYGQYRIVDEPLLNKILDRYNDAVKDAIIFRCPDQTIPEPPDYYPPNKPEPRYALRRIYNRHKACLLAEFVQNPGKYTGRKITIEPPGNQDIFDRQTKDNRLTVLLTNGEMIRSPDNRLELVDIGRKRLQKQVAAPLYKICTTDLLQSFFVASGIITTDDLPPVVEQ